MKFEEKLRELILQIEQSPIPEADKIVLYSVIKASLHKISFPILTKHMPEEKLIKLSENLSEVTPEKYLELVKEALDKPTFVADMEKYMTEFLEDFENHLRQEGTIK